MSNEEEMNWQIPGFPVFFKITAVPPISIEISVSESNQLRYYVEKHMEKDIKT